jgi:riboflavin synthase
MFTGLITDVGRVRAVEARAGGARIAIETAYETGEIPLGASIACCGACMTVVEKAPGWFAIDVSAESLARTTLGSWEAGRRVNLERSLRLGDELGGHMVTGHVDAVAEIVDRRPDGESLRFTVAVPEAFARFIAPKGSAALDGVSLTVNEVEGRRFGVNIIPHTAAQTTFGALEAGDRINFEVDLIARYVARLVQPETTE